MIMIIKLHKRQNKNYQKMYIKMISISKDANLRTTTNFISSNVISPNNKYSIIFLVFQIQNKDQ